MKNVNRELLLAAIEEKDCDAVKLILDQTEAELDLDFLAAAEQTGDESVVILVLDHSAHYGFDNDPGYENQLIMAVSRGFVISARFIAETFSGDRDFLSQRDSCGYTAAEIARQKGMDDLADEIEGHLR